MAKKPAPKKAEIAKAELFEKATDSYKAIFTNDGLNLEGMLRLIDNCLEMLDPNDRALWAHNIIFEAALQGMGSYYETIGVLESVKHEYEVAWDNSVGQQDEDDDDK